MKQSEYHSIPIQEFMQIQKYFMLTLRTRQISPGEFRLLIEFRINWPAGNLPPKLPVYFKLSTVENVRETRAHSLTEIGLDFC